MAGPDPYLKSQVMTATPHALHLMVVNGALRYAKFAAKSLAEGNYALSHVSLNRSRLFVGEMIAGLRPEHAPELVANLKALFHYAYSKLVRADGEKNAVLIDEAIAVLESHRDAWTALGQKLSQAEQNRPAAAPAAIDPATMRIDREAGASTSRGPHFATGAATAKPARLSRVI